MEKAGRGARDLGPHQGYSNMPAMFAGTGVQETSRNAVKQSRWRHAFIASIQVSTTYLPRHCMSFLHAALIDKVSKHKQHAKM